MPQKVSSETRANDRDVCWADRAIGGHCVGVLEAVSRTVYDPAKHLYEGETAPAPDKTKQRLGRYVEVALPGATNVELRGLVTKAI